MTYQAAGFPQGNRTATEQRSKVVGMAGLFLAATVWHYWLGVALFVIMVVAIVITAVAYFWKVNSLKYPKS